MRGAQVGWSRGRRMRGTRMGTWRLWLGKRLKVLGDISFVGAHGSLLCSGPLNTTDNSAMLTLSDK